MNQPISPKREIKSSQRSLRGKIPSKKMGRFLDFESSLERDFIEILEFDNNVLEYTEQPITIEFLDNGINRNYTPDFLVYYREDKEPASKYLPLLCEIKYSEELERNQKELEIRFSAAEKYAANMNWRFKILTEKEIRNGYLWNVKFLSHYKESIGIDINDFSLLLWKIAALRFTTVESLLMASTRSEDKRPELLYTIWHMIATGAIACDLNYKMTMKTEIWDRLPI